MTEDDYQKARQGKIEAFRQKQAEDLQKKQVLKRLLDDRAFERMMNVRIANSELYDSLVMLLIQLAQGGKLAGRITDAQLLGLLEKVQQRKKEPNITFKRK